MIMPFATPSKISSKELIGIGHFCCCFSAAACRACLLHPSFGVVVRFERKFFGFCAGPPQRKKLFTCHHKSTTLQKLDCNLQGWENLYSVTKFAIGSQKFSHAMFYTWECSRFTVFHNFANLLHGTGLTGSSERMENTASLTPRSSHWHAVVVRVLGYIHCNITCSVVLSKKYHI